MKIAHIFFNECFESRGIRFEKYSLKNNIKIVPYFKKNNQHYLTYLFSTIRGILKSDIKIIHAHRISGFIPAIFTKILKPKIRIIYDKHDIHKYDFIFDKFIFLTDFVLVASDLHLDYIKKYTRNSIVIPNYSDFKRISPALRKKIRKKIGIKENEILLLFQGSIVKDYGLDLLLNALPRIDKRIKLVIIGWIKEEEYWKEIKSKLTDRVFYLGAKKYTEMNNYVGAADIGVVLFKKSRLTLFGNPNKLFEFINCKVPLIVTNLKGVSKYIKKYNNGIIVNNEEDLIKAANKMLDKKIRNSYSKNSPNLQFEKEFEKYKKILSSITKLKGERPF